MLDLHALNGARNAVGLVPIYGQWTSGGYVAKSARARADVAQNHEGRSALSPAFTHVRAASRLTDGVELVLVHDVAHGAVVRARGQLDAQPVGLAHGRWVRI